MFSFFLKLTQTNSHFSQKINYSFLNDGEDSDASDDAEPEMFDNRLEESVKQQNMTLDDESDFEAQDESFVENSPVKAPPKQRKLGPKMTTDDDDTPVKKPKSSKRPAKTLDSGSSDDEKPKKVSLTFFFL